MPEPELPHLLLVGPPGHGVVRYARELADAVRAADESTSIITVPDVDGAVAAATMVDRAHVHVTDRLFGSSPEEAADSLERMASATRLAITLHDLPQASDGAPLARRVAAYARFAHAADAVVVNSQHEAQLVEEYLGQPAASVAVIPLGTRHPLPLSDSESPTNRSDDPLVALIAGYIYPGKGHREAITAVADAVASLRSQGSAPADAAVVAIGGTSPGHEGDVADLLRLANERGVRLRVTGYLDDSAYDRELAGFGIPVAAHQHVSASRSMLDWIEHGRRPLVVDSRYSREMAALRPGTMTLFDSAALADELVAAWHDPAATRLAAGTSLAPTLASTADAYRSWWAAVS
ncbi:glycosyltransferase family 4 protein [Glaciibacter flavus]|uniref:Glycosyltransferase family 4 protein n=1 Tax=Orlajensenia flava TaxID=2565934 RepID=A0A4S4FM96_9MICO|nr:glycosyltransferase [Glaciibacter flavus]THG30376.1 glycosyltransferase family 4 protein [Glaciibacter flavus]